MHLASRYVCIVFVYRAFCSFIHSWRIQRVGSVQLRPLDFAPTFHHRASCNYAGLRTEPTPLGLQSSRSKTRFNSFYTFLLAWNSYRAMNNGSTAISPHFVVPSEPNWPQECWGMKLGTKVVNARAKRIYRKPNEIEMLSKVGFEWSPSKVSAEQVLEALRVFIQQEGHASIPHDFTVPALEVYPHRLWGMKLGAKLKNFRYRGDYSDHKEAFQALGVTAEKLGVDTRQWDAVHAGLLAYEALLGEANKMSRAWEVPSEPPWPEISWGVKLGYRVHNMRYRGDYIMDNSTRRAQAADLGIYYKPPGTG